MKKFGIVAAIIGCIFLIIGFYKIGAYEEPAWSNDYKGVNAYVGGDAYNYIINSGYFAGYSALGGALLVVGGVLFAAGSICEELKATRHSNNEDSLSSSGLATEAEDTQNETADDWKCPICGKNNPSCTEICECGLRKTAE